MSKKPAPISSVLVANRGEIAVRILRAARELGIRGIAVHSEADRGAVHTREAELSVEIGRAPAAESYLRIDALISAARGSGAEAIHPGYGFLAENAEFAEACDEAGLLFIGPPAAAIRRMGSKAEARSLAEDAGVPVIPGYNGEDQSDARLTREAERIGRPLLIKPSAGGGGKGMRRVDAGEPLAPALSAARREAAAAFGDDHLILERFLEEIRHVEIQVFADRHGNALHLLERECSVQRRHQKIVEECPSPVLSAETREKMGRAAVALAQRVGYRNAGTVEFVLLPDQTFYFLEMNTRLQVEHPVTEWVTGIDLVRLQFREAAGDALPFRQEEVRARGHAIEVRIYAEDPSQDFLPSAGQVLLFDEPRGPGVRVDSGIQTGSTVPVHYDPILAKLSVHAETRPLAIGRMARALDETVLFGLRTNLAFLQEVVRHAAFAAGDTTTDFIERHLGSRVETDAPDGLAWVLATLALTAPHARCGGVERGPLSPWDQLAGFRLGQGGAAS